MSKSVDHGSKIILHPGLLADGNKGALHLSIDHGSRGTLHPASEHGSKGTLVYPSSEHGSRGTLHHCEDTNGSRLLLHHSSEDRDSHLPPTAAGNHGSRLTLHHPDDSNDVRSQGHMQYHRDSRPSISSWGTGHRPSDDSTAGVPTVHVQVQ